MKAIITGFQSPQGECVDRPGNIYIVDAFADTIEEYSRAGEPIATYPNDYGYGVSCAVNPTNGELALTNDTGFRGGDGQVMIFSNSTSPPTILTNPEQAQYWFAGYDPSGDLWVDGYPVDITQNNKFIMSSCNASSCSTVPISNGAINTAGAVQWDSIRGTWTVFDLYCKGEQGSCSYPVSGTGVLGSPTTYTNYNGTVACQNLAGRHRSLPRFEIRRRRR